MKFSQLLGSNGTPYVKKIQTGEASSTVGVPHRASDGDDAGPILAETVTCADFVGVSIDTQGTLVTAQQTDGSDPERAVSLIINPDAVYEARLSGGATSDTALDLKTVTTASTTGLAVTTSDDFSSTSFDEGSIWGYSGNNVGVLRKITSVSTTAATVTVAFPADTAVGDEFLAAPFFPLEDQNLQLTTALDQINASVAVDSDNDNFRILDVLARDITDNGRTNSAALIVAFDSIFGAGGSV